MPGVSRMPWSSTSSKKNCAAAVAVILCGGPRYGPPDCSSEGGYAPLGLPRPTLGRATAPPGRASGLIQDVSPVVDPAIEQHELPERERGQDHEQHHGQRRRVRRVPELEADVVDGIEEQLGR